MQFSTEVWKYQNQSQRMLTIQKSIKTSEHSVAMLSAENVKVAQVFLQPITKKSIKKCNEAQVFKTSATSPDLDYPMIIL